MRRVLATLLPAVLAGLCVLAGCSTTPPPPLVNKPATPVPSTPQQPQLRQAVVGVDTVAGGYNPHTQADLSTVTTALAQLLLPSVFRPSPDGTPRLDTTVMSSAEVTSAKPFTVTYTVRTDASWSDGVPVAAEDFLYLRDQMATQPGVIDPAGYRLITDISARANGKVVQVRFAKPYPGWRSLFHNLLPAHLLKDAPGGWQGALATNFPAVAGPFAVRSIDTGRGEIVLQRNDRYWAQPSKLDRIVLRATPDADVVNALRTGDDQLASFAVDQPTRQALRELGDRVAVRSVPRATVVQLLLRPATDPLSDERVRAAVAAALDRKALITAGTRQALGSLRADALVFAPSQRDYRPTMPARAPIATGGLSMVRSKLGAAGYALNGGVWTRDGAPLRLTIAAPRGDPLYGRLARLVGQQLIDAGIEVSVTTPPATQLFGTQLAGDSQGPDIAVVPRAVGGDGAATLAAQFGCPDHRQDAPVPPPNLSGFCDRSLQPAIDAAVTGALPLAEALHELAPQLWRSSVVIPLFQRADEVAVGNGVSGVAEGPPLVGPFPSAPGWVTPSHG